MVDHSFSVPAGCQNFQFEIFKTSKRSSCTTSNINKKPRTSRCLALFPARVSKFLWLHFKMSLSILKSSILTCDVLPEFTFYFLTTYRNTNEEKALTCHHFIAQSELRPWVCSLACSLVTGDYSDDRKTTASKHSTYVICSIVGYRKISLS